MSKLVLTAVHISDLHIGLVDPASGQSHLDGIDERWWRHFSLFHGYLGHCGRALEQLAEFHASQRAMAEKAGSAFATLVTGDITATGNAQEFVNAEAFLTGRLPVPGVPRSIGLMHDEFSELYMTPGNHDVWSGHSARSLGDFPMLGGPTAAFRTYFPDPVQVYDPIPLANGFSLRFVAIDSNADANSRFQKIAARGSFASACATLRARLPSHANGEARILLLHHSYAHRWRVALGMGLRSAIALRTLVHDAKISVMFTGHVHDPRPTTAGLSEVRCGCTTARDEFPKTWQLPPNGHTLPRNTSLVHKVYEDGNKLILESELWRRLRLKDGNGRRSRNRPFSRVPRGNKWPGFRVELQT